MSLLFNSLLQIILGLFVCLHYSSVACTVLIHVTNIDKLDCGSIFQTFYTLQPSDVFIPLLLLLMVAAVASVQRLGPQ